MNTYRKYFFLMVIILLSQMSCDKSDTEKCNILRKNVGQLFFFDTLSKKEISELNCFLQDSWVIHNDNNNNLHNIKYVLDKQDTSIVFIYSGNGQHKLSYLIINNFQGEINDLKNKFIDNFINVTDTLVDDSVDSITKKSVKYHNNKYQLQIDIYPNKKLTIMKYRK